MVTEMTIDEMLDMLERYPAAVKGTISVAGDRLVDVIGVVHSNQAQIRDQKRLAMSELEPAVGQRWSMEQGRQAKRTYNTPGILAAILAKWEGDLLSLLLHLQAIDVLRFGWQWSKLDQFAYSLALPLTKAPTEISDDDPKYLVGEVWGPASPKFEPVMDEEEDGQEQATP